MECGSHYWVWGEKGYFWGTGESFRVQGEPPLLEIWQDWNHADCAIYTWYLAQEKESLFSGWWEGGEWH